MTFEPARRKPQDSNNPPQAESGQEPVSCGDGAWRQVASFEIASEPGNERLAMERIAREALPFRLPPARLERLKTAAAEATMNAMEHGNHFQPERPVAIEVWVQEGLSGACRLSVRIRDDGGGPVIPESEAPDIEAKLAGLQSPRGWGLFLIKNMVDELNVSSGAEHHTVELVLYLEQEPT